MPSEGALHSPMLRDDKGHLVEEPLECGSCRAQVPAGSRFCNMCGSRLETEEPASEGSGQEAPSAGRSQSPQELAERAIQTILEQQNIPAFSQHVFQIMSMVRDDESSLRHLTNIILRDYSLTLAILRTANSAYYNRAGKAVCSVARAVTLMGVEAVRSLVGSLVLLENYNKSSEDLKELLILATLTANQCRQTAKQLSVVGAEEAYLCGMFRSLGEVLVASQLTDIHSRIKKEMEERHATEHEACMKLLGYCYEDLGRAMAKNWNLPDFVGETMGPVDTNRKPKNRRDYLSTVVGFCYELTNAVYRRQPSGQVASVSDLIDKYKNVLRVKAGKVEEMMQIAVSETKDTFSTVGLPLDDLLLLEKDGDDLSAETSDAAASAQPSSSPASGESGRLEGLACCDEDLLDRLVAEVELASEPQSELPLNDILMMALEACQRGAHFERVVFCLTSPDRSHVRGRIGLGQAIDAVIEQLHIPLKETTDPLSFALSSKRDLFVDNRRSNPYQHQETVKKLGAECFGLMPIVVDGLVVGCLYYDRLRAEPLPNQKVLETLGRLRDILAGVIQRTRSQSR